MSTILEICQDVASLVATQKPDTLFDTDNQQSAIFLSIAKDTLESLRRYGDWQELTKEGSLTVTPNKSIYRLRDVCPDFYSLMNNTVYVRDNVGVSEMRFKIQNNCLRFLTPPTQRCRIVFYYRSSVIAVSSETDCPCDEIEKTTLTADTDIPVFDEYLVKLGIIWRWYKRNGLPYEEEFNEYTKEVKNRFSNGLCLKDIPLARCFDTSLNGLGGVHVITKA